MKNRTQPPIKSKKCPCCKKTYSKEYMAEMADKTTGTGCPLIKGSGAFTCENCGSTIFYDTWFDPAPRSPGIELKNLDKLINCTRHKFTKIRKDEFSVKETYKCVHCGGEVEYGWIVDLYNQGLDHGLANPEGWKHISDRGWEYHELVDVWDSHGFRLTDISIGIDDGAPVFYDEDGEWLDIMVTHWRPIPAPPESKATESTEEAE